MTGESRMARAQRWLALFALAFLVSGVPAFAQLTTGTISGSVTDQSGAAIPGATVTATNTETGIVRRTVTGPQGKYEFPNLQAGHYDVTATASGFQTSVRSGIELTIGRSAVVNHSLQVGEVTQTVTVTGEAPLIDTTSATVSNVVDEQAVENLPLGGRDLTQLTFLQPGVLKVPRTGGGVFSGMGDTLTVAGARGTQNLFLLDGVSNADLSGNPQGASGYYTGAETVQEFQVITNNYSAEYQSAAGAIVSAITKSGTNSLHGSGFWTLRNDNLDAARWEDNAFGGKKPEFKRNQFGGSLGGPIVRDRTFFFGSYEGFRERQSTTDTARILTAAAHDGLVPLDSKTCDKYKGQLLPSGNCQLTINSEAKPYVDVFPLPGQGNALVQDYGDGTALISGTQRQPVNSEFVSGKLDHQLSSSNMLSATFNWDKSDRSPFGVLGSLNAQGSSNEKYTISSSYTAIISPTVLNEFNFGYSDSTIFGDVPLSNRDLSALSFHPNRDRMGQLNVGDATAIGYRVDYSKYTQRALQFKDGLSLTMGNHSLRIGAALKRFRYLMYSCSRGCNGIWDFNSVSDFLVNNPKRFQIFIPGSESPPRNMTQYYPGFYFQDNWQVASSLTLNLGLRYEFVSDITEDKDQISALVDFFDNQVSVPASIVPQFPNIQPPFAGTINKFFKNPTKKSFSPRFGFAWAPGDHKTSIRGGFGIFYEMPGLYSLRTSLQELPPYVIAGRLDAKNAPKDRPLLMQPQAATLYSDLLQGRPNIRYMEYDWKNTYIYRWSMSLQRELGANWMVAAEYTGSRAAHLIVQNISNYYRWIGWPTQPSGPKRWAGPDAGKQVYLNSNFGEIRTQSPLGNSFFEGLALSAQKRMSHGLQLQMSYNFSKNVDDGSGVTSGGDELLQSQRGMYQWDMNLKRGLSQYDIRNSFTLNFTYDLPTQQFTGGKGALLGGWTLNGILTLTDGSPLSVYDQNSIFEDYSGDNEGVRANLIPGGNNNPVKGGPNGYFDTSQFVPNFCTGSEFCSPGDPSFLVGFGNAGRNTVVGPGLATMDFSVLKKFNVTENHRIEFRAEFFNFFNRVNFGEPNMNPFKTDGTKRNAAAATITSTRGSAREIQLGLKYTF